MVSMTHGQHHPQDRQPASGSTICFTLQITLNVGLFACRWSFLTSALVHHDVEQLGRNMFIVFFFSQIVYRDLGAVGVWFTYLLAGLGK